jgi:hypothetical protein
VLNEKYPVSNNFLSAEILLTFTSNRVKSARSLLLACGSLQG